MGKQQSGRYAKSDAGKKVSHRNSVSGRIVTSAYPKTTIRGTVYHLVRPQELRTLIARSGRVTEVESIRHRPPASPPVEVRAVTAGAMPPLPKPDTRGNVPAVAFARANIAREIVQRRAAIGLSQSDLAHRAGIRQETLSRLETGKTSPALRTVEKVERALVGAEALARRHAERRHGGALN